MNDVPINDTRKAELLSTKVEHIDIRSYDARPIIDAMGKMSFTSRDLARATGMAKSTLTSVLTELIQLGYVVQLGKGYAPGSRLLSLGYQVAGKTGTARKLVDGRYVRRYMASFVGFLPASDPRVVIVVSIDEPATRGVASQV